MKKILALTLIMLLAFGYVAYSDEPAGDGYELMGRGGANGITPRTIVVPVRYGYRSANALSLVSGDVVMWDTNSADGLTISACVVDNGVPSGGSYAGVLVSTIQTADNSSVRRNDRNWGKMAVKGYALAKVDSTGATAGYRLIINGGTLGQSFAAAGATVPISNDIGILLQAPTATDGLAPVWLR